MSKKQIPESWASSTLGDIVDKVQYGATASAKKSGKLRLLRITDITDSGVNWDDVPFCNLSINEGNKYILQDGDILIARTGGTVGKSFRVIDPPENTIFASYLIRLCPNELIRSSRYVELFLKSSAYWKMIREGAKGAAQPNVNSETLKNIKIPLPPLVEQARIVTKIESIQSKIQIIDDRVSKAECLISKYRAALLRKAFRGQLVTQDPHDEPASELLKRIKVERNEPTKGKKKGAIKSPPEQPYETPNSWEWVTLAEIGEWGGGITPSKANVKFWRDGAINWISPKDVKTDILVTSEDKITKTALDASNIKLYPPHAILLVTRSGILRHSLPVASLAEPSTVNQDIKVVVPGPELEPRYFFYFFKAFEFEILRTCSKKGATVESIDFDRLKSFAVPIPPKEEQLRIAKLLDQLLTQIDQNKLTLQKILHLKSILSSSILSRAFTGKLSPQDESEGTGHDLVRQIIDFAKAQNGEQPKIRSGHRKKK